MISKEDLGNILQENVNCPNIKNNIYKLNESQKVKVTDKIAAIIFKKIKSKMTDPSYKTIEATKGDVNKLNGFSDVIKMTNYLERISNNDPNSTMDFKKSILVVKNSIDFLIKRKSSFNKAFSDKNQLAICLYDAVIIGTLRVLNNIMHTCITVNADKYNYSVKAVKMYKNQIMNDGNTKSLLKILKLDSNNKINDIFNLKEGQINNLVKNESVTLVIFGVVLAIVTFLFAARYIVFFFFNTKYKIAKTLEDTSEMIEMNTLALNDSDKNQKIKEKQLKYAEKFKKRAEELNEDNKISENKTENDIKDNDEEINQTAQDETEENNTNTIFI